MNYNDDFINSTDDDLFQEDSSSKSKNIADALSHHLKDTHNIDIDTKDLISDVQTNNDRARIAIALYEAAGKWNNESTSAGFIKASHDVLDSLTNGVFSKTVFYYRTEVEIVQLRTIKVVLEPLCEGDYTALQEISEKLNLNIDNHFVAVYLQSMLAIIADIVKFKEEVYYSLANDLKLPLSDSVTKGSEDSVSFKQISFFHNRINRSADREYVKSIIAKKNNS